MAAPDKDMRSLAGGPIWRTPGSRPDGPLRPFRSGESGAALRDASRDPAGMPGVLTTLTIAAGMTAVPVVLHLIGQGAAIAGCIVLSTLCALFAAPALPVALIFSYLFQNFVVALISPGIESLEQFNAIRAYNFVFTVVAWAAIVAPYWLARSRYDRQLRTLVDLTTIGLALIGVYFVIGLTVNPAGAVVYLRNIATPVLLFQVFALVAYRHRVSIMTALLTLALCLIAYGYLELFTHDALFRTINADVYMRWRIKQDFDAGAWVKELHETSRVFRSYLDTLLVDFLNTPLTQDLRLQFYRLLGPNFHFISYAYAVAFFCVFLCASGRWWFGALALPLLLVVGSKGALIFTILALGGTVGLLRLRGAAPLAIFVALLMAYVAAGVVVGLRSQDYHVIGFIGGLRGFLSNPLGRGIGVGGNLSINMSTIDWSKSQQLGHTDVAVESSIGVLLYQMGGFAVVIFVALAWIAWRLWKHYQRSGERLYATAAFSVLVVSANGVFQEEAMFSPLALGLVLGAAGLLLGRAARAPVYHDCNPSFSTPGNCIESVGRRNAFAGGSRRAVPGKRAWSAQHG
jgi:DNA-binding transcriptional regulator of glucitol operon